MLICFKYIKHIELDRYEIYYSINNYQIKLLLSAKNICMIKKRNRSEFFLRQTLGNSLEQVHIELIERPHILGTLWNWSEEWKASQVQSLFVLNFAASRYAFLILCFQNSRLYVISHEWSRSVYIPLHVFCMRYKTVFSMCLSNMRGSREE